MKYLGVEKLIVSNASGGVNPRFKVGDIMIITDHINMMPKHPLHGKNEARFGPRFVDMHEAYCKKMIEKMPETLGVFYIHDSNGNVIFIGKHNKLLI